MKTVRYTGPDAPPITIGGADGVFVTDDQGVIEVPDDLAARLVEQEYWRSAGARAATVAEVLDQVGGDPTKASEALAAEQASDKPRPKLVAALTKIVAEPGESDPDVADRDDADTTSEED